MKRKATILFVDDEERILRSLKMLFKSHYNVRTATDGYKALDIVRNQTVHVVVSDQRMPVMMGVDLLKTVKKVSPNTMRLLLTGYSDLNAAIESVNEGEIFRYINKPWNSEEIRTTIDKAAEVALQLENLPLATSANDASLEPVGREDSWRLLVIDPDPQTQAVIREVTGKDYGARCEVLFSVDMDESFDILQRHEVAGVVAEANIGGIDMTAAVKALKRHRPEILTIILSSFEDTNVLVELINEGQIYRFPPKPARRGLLSPSIRSALARSQTLKASPQLLERHAVEPPKNPDQAKLSSKVMGYLKKLKGRYHPDETRIH